MLNTIVTPGCYISPWINFYSIKQNIDVILELSRREKKMVFYVRNYIYIETIKNQESFGMALLCSDSKFIVASIIARSHSDADLLAKIFS